MPSFKALGSWHERFSWFIYFNDYLDEEVASTENEQGMAVRLKDIARDLGVSVVTVSKVLRNHEDIGSETRERVLKRMRDLKYEPNLAARALVTGKTQMIGLVVPDLIHPFFAEVAKGISRVLRINGYGLVIASSEEDPDLEKQEIRQMLARRLDGLVIASAQWTVDSFRAIEERQRPYLLVDRKFAGLAANFVGTNNREVGRIGTEHLLEIGRRRIAYIGGQHISTAVERLEGYHRALSSYGLPYIDEHVVCHQHADEAADEVGYAAMRELLLRKPRADAVYCHNDPLALGAMKAALEAGLRIPEDLAIIGSGNVHYASMLRIPLSSIDQASSEVGEHAARLVLKLIGSEETKRPEEILIPPKLVVRDSTVRQKPI